MVTWAALKAARPGLLEESARAWQDLGSRLGAQAQAFAGEIAALDEPGVWAGLAADAAGAHLRGLSAGLRVTQEDAAAMVAVLRDAAAGIGDAQALALAAEEAAANSHQVIAADGSVQAEPVPPQVALQQVPLFAAPAARSAAAGDAAGLVARALALADEVDARITAALDALPAATSGGASSALAAGAALTGTFDKAVLPAEGASPAEVNAWWNALDHAQQQRLIHEFPSRIGWLDGLPAVARDQANRIALATEQQNLQTRLASLEASPPPATLPAVSPRFGPQPNPAYQHWQAEIAAIQGQQAQISAVDQALNIAGKNGYPPAYLLGFNTNGNGHAIVSIGNPDTAANTVTYVPGVGSKLTGAYGDTHRAAVLWRQASLYAPGAKIASVYWLGYNAPQLGLSQGLGNAAMAFTNDAVAGAPALAHFQAGLAAAHQAGLPSHTVVLGHSYGTLVAGEAAARDGLHPSDMILVGSPGVGVNQASQLGMSPAHVWAGLNPHDPVPDLPPANSSLAGWATEWTQNIHYQSHFGVNPASPVFGGQVFNATADPSRSFHGLDFAAHSAYWDPRSDSLKNMARIVDGQYSAVIHQQMPMPTPNPQPGPAPTVP